MKEGLVTHDRLRLSKIQLQNLDLVKASKFGPNSGRWFSKRTLLARTTLGTSPLNNQLQFVHLYTPGSHQSSLSDGQGRAMITLGSDKEGSSLSADRGNHSKLKQIMILKA